MTRMPRCGWDSCDKQAEYRVDFIESWYPLCAEHTGQVISDGDVAVYGVQPLLDHEGGAR